MASFLASAVVAGILLGLVAGVLIARWLWPDVSSALTEAHQRYANLSNEKRLLELEHDGLREQADIGGTALHEKANLTAQIVELQESVSEKDEALVRLAAEMTAVECDLKASQSSFAKALDGLMNAQLNFPTRNLRLIQLHGAGLEPEAPEERPLV